MFFPQLVQKTDRPKLGARPPAIWRMRKATYCSSSTRKIPGMAQRGWQRSGKEQEQRVLVLRVHTLPQGSPKGSGEHGNPVCDPRQIILSQLYLRASTAKDGSMTPPRRRSTCRAGQGFAQGPPTPSPVHSGERRARMLKLKERQRQGACWSD